MRVTTKIRSILTIGFAIGLGQAVWAQPADRPPRGGERPDREALRKQILERFDKNKDGELDEEEREAARNAFRRGERPGEQPRAEGRPPGPPSRGSRSRGGRGGRGSRGQRIQLLPQFDKDGDGILNKAERVEARKFVLENAAVAESAVATGEAPEADARQDRTVTEAADLRDRMGTAVDAHQGLKVTGAADRHGRETIGAGARLDRMETAEAGRQGRMTVVAERSRHVIFRRRKNSLPPTRNLPRKGCTTRAHCARCSS